MQAQAEDMRASRASMGMAEALASTWQRPRPRHGRGLGLGGLAAAHACHVQSALAEDRQIPLSDALPRPRWASGVCGKETHDSKGGAAGTFFCRHPIGDGRAFCCFPGPVRGLAEDRQDSARQVAKLIGLGALGRGRQRCACQVSEFICLLLPCTKTHTNMQASTSASHACQLWHPSWPILVSRSR